MVRPIAVLALVASMGCRSNVDTSGLQDQIDALAEENATLRTEVDQLKLDVAALQSAQDATDAALTANTTADAELAAELDAISGGVDVTELADDVDALVVDLDDHESRITAIEEAPYATEVWVAAQGYATVAAVGVLDDRLDTTDGNVAALQVASTSQGATLANHTTALASNATMLADHGTRIGALETRANTADTTLATYLTRLDGHDTTLASLDTRIDGNDTTLATYLTRLDGHDTALATVNATVADHTTTLGTLGTTVAGHTTSIGTLNTTVAGHATTLGTLGTTVAGHTTSIGTLNTTVAGHTTTLGTLNTTVTGHTSTLGTLNGTVSTHTTTLTTHAGDIAAIEGDVVVNQDEAQCLSRLGRWTGTACVEFTTVGCSDCPWTTGLTSCGAGRHMCTWTELMSGGFASLAAQYKQGVLTPTSHYVWTKGYNSDGNTTTTGNQLYYPWGYTNSPDSCQANYAPMFGFRNNGGNITGAMGCYDKNYLGALAPCCENSAY